MSNFKLNITEIPTYNDGYFYLYKIDQDNTKFPIEKIKRIEDNEYYYKELSLADNIRFENDKRDKKIVKKIRIPQDKSINSLNILEIDNDYYEIFNIYHFTNKDGYLESDITLQEYPNPIIKENVIDEER